MNELATINESIGRLRAREMRQANELDALALALEKTRQDIDNHRLRAERLINGDETFSSLDEYLETI